MAYTHAKIVDLIDGNYIDILQGRMAWHDKIVLPLAPKLYIVQLKDSK